MSRGRAVAQRLIPALIKPEITQTESGEDELTRNADVIHRGGAIGLEEGAVRVVVFSEHDLLPSAGTEGGVFLPLPRLFHRLPIPHLHPDVGVLQKASKQIPFKVGI